LIRSTSFVELVASIRQNRCRRLAGIISTAAEKDEEEKRS
jgi:hypothetical protein